MVTKLQTWLIADPHFGHESIIRMCQRPFVDVAEMDRTMAESWRAVVRPHDDVIVVGDFAHRMPLPKLTALFSSLPGKKHLVCGNHDGEETKALPWTSVHDIAFTVIDSTRVVLCHYRMLSWPGSRKPTTLMLYGHHHGRIPGNQQSCDIGVDVMGWAPVRLAAIKAHLATLPPRPDPEAGDDFESDLPIP
jgi:calcineurin-like phosphoesterase family protein